jgi:hypothetical protein
LEAQAIKYLTRWRAKGGWSDLEKAQHFMDKIFETARAEGWEPEASAGGVTSGYTDQARDRPEATGHRVSPAQLGQR